MKLKIVLSAIVLFCIPVLGNVLVDEMVKSIQSIQNKLPDLFEKDAHEKTISVLTTAVTSLKKSNNACKKIEKQNIDCNKNLQDSASQLKSVTKNFEDFKKTSVTKDQWKVAVKKIRNDFDNKLKVVQAENEKMKSFIKNLNEQQKFNNSQKTSQFMSGFKVQKSKFDEDDE